MAAAIPPFDAGGPIDGARDTGGNVADDAADVDASAVSSWCALNAPWATLCDDFDLSTMPRPEWSPSGTGLSVVGTLYQSAPHALHATAVAMTSSYLAFGSTGAVGAKIDLELQLAVDGTSTSADNPILVSLAAPDGKRVALEALPGTSTGRCAFEGFTSSDVPFVDFPLSRGAVWHGVSMKISFNSDNTVNFICFVDGADHSLWNEPAGSSLGDVGFDVGVLGMTTGPMEAYYDNVVIDVSTVK